MRLWSLHPSLLDAKGLVALWRETLLAQHVLLGKTKGYKFHPQLDRFKVAPDPLAAMACYLTEVQKEAVVRGYNFNADKIAAKPWRFTLTVTKGQVAYELEHLKNKLQVRDPLKLKHVKNMKTTLLHPLFTEVAGNIEPWERIL